MIGSIIEECDRLLEMINMMLDISEAEAGISKLKKSEINCSELLKNSCELFGPIADDKGIRIVTELLEDVTIYADNKKLQRVVANLLDNAIKYSRTEGTIVVSLYRDGKNVSISIKDNGTGISPDDLPYIFKRFYRCDSSRSNIGNGLGLCWALAIIEAHGGSISVSSTRDKGSTFIITIPLN
jgi:signal transduction histidine kinase